ncbi:methionine ABC transporter ATP-binding protein [Oecophyllibacter saccharovorans]|uniref:Cell division ATP-binding protein FtsE n=1 Tax=Oecophyllibacter saccharovorans TaxID=2558360 RepID=A0A506UKH4_9PROT|nr:ATP-binding cassette domain-containing protein [Oecophyllibacter saccharovorans]TPW33815.1 ATP-binding cassette domain-containing protein [Oecophyllibacter saccharovorans]
MSQEAGAQEKAPDVLLAVEHVSRSFSTGASTPPVPALKDVSFTVRRGEVVGLIGRSGAGKSTLLRCLCALERPQEGRILFNGQDLATLPETRLIDVRRRIGLVFQHFNLLNSRNVAGNIALSLQIAGWPRARQKERVAELLKLVGLEGFERKYPSQLSGGQKQRVGIARALAAKPDLLLCDEATSALDPESTAAILNLLEEINRSLGLTIVLITHEMDVVKRFARRVLVLDHGSLVEDGTMMDFLRNRARNPALSPLLAEIQPQLPPAYSSRLAPLPVTFRPEVKDRAWEESWRELLTRSPGAQLIMRLVLDSRTAISPLFSDLDRRFEVETHLLQGGVGTIGEALAGDMIIGLTGHRVPETVRYLQERASGMEVLGYVPSDR